MIEVLSQVEFEALSTDDELGLDRLTTDLEAGLADFGQVSRIAREAEPGDKGTGELVQATLNVLSGVDPVQIEAMFRFLAGFAKRNRDRKVSVRIGRDRISIDGASEEQIDDLVATFKAAVERHKR
ncbi:MAG: hypothetical protein QOH03_3694 [Kribbellaceae bacterium]|nr:hypothetical protein [Kribbellaceae bacterium]